VDDGKAKKPLAKPKAAKKIEHGISEYFSWKEAIYLPKWNRLATADELTPEIIENLTRLFMKMDQIRHFLRYQIIVHCAFRTKKYNKEVGGATRSPHLEGKAVDFSVRGMNCDDVRSTILRYGILEKLDLRMENNPQGSPWVHIDTRDPGPKGKRYFLP